MSDSETVIQHILAAHPEINRDQVLTRLSVARNMTGGLIADDSLLRMIAAELGVEVPNENGSFKQRLSLGHLVAGLSNATVTGRIVAVYPVKTFEGNKPGKFGSVTIVDNDGVLRVLLWNEQANVIEKGEVQLGQIVKFAHGYTKADRFGIPELHIGEKSRVDFNPPNVNPEDYPSVSRFSTKISQLSLEMKNVNLEARIVEVYSPSTFTRNDQTVGKVQRIKVRDDTGEVAVVFWNEKADETQTKLKRGASVQIVNGRIKANQQAGEAEVHVDSASFANISETPKQVTRIANLSEGSGDICVEGEVASLPVSKEVKTGKGEMVKLTTFDIKDESGLVRVTAWREHAESASKLIFGEKISLENVYAKMGYNGKLELSTRTASIIFRPQNFP